MSQETFHYFWETQKDHQKHMDWASNRIELTFYYYTYKIKYHEKQSIFLFATILHNIANTVMDAHEKDKTILLSFLGMEFIR